MILRSRVRASLVARLAGMLAAASTLLACSSATPKKAAPPEDLPVEADSAPPPPGADDAGAAEAGEEPGDAAPPPNGTSGCGKPGVVAGVRENLTLDVGGVSRVYTLWVPESYRANRAYRLVFGLHSGGRNGASARPYLDLESRAQDTAVFVYPDGLRGNWDLETPYPQNRDIALFDALLRSLSDTLCLDKTRVFAVGTSSGAYFANQLACARGDMLRAIASHAGGGPFATPGKYDDKGHLICPTPAVAAAIFHGLADTNVSPSEGDKAIAHWSFWNECGATREPRAPSPCESPAGCKRPVLVCKVPGQGHAVWAPARQATWDFFAQF